MRQNYQGFPVVHPKCVLCARREKFANCKVRRRATYVEPEASRDDRYTNALNASRVLYTWLPQNMVPNCRRNTQYNSFSLSLSLALSGSISIISGSCTFLGRPGPLFARFIGGSVHRIGIVGASSGSFEKKEVIFPLLASISTRECSHTLRTCALIMRQKMINYILCILILRHPSKIIIFSMTHN